MLFAAGALIPAGLLPCLAGMAGAVYGVAAVLLGAGLFYSGWRLARRRTIAEARRLLHASVIYLPLLYTFLLLSPPKR